MGELQAAVRDFLEQEFGRVWVEGELSGVKRPQSGHVYFALKDEKARLDVVLWRSSAARLKFQPEDGLVVRVRGRLTVYAPQGRYQMEADAIEPVGAGPLQIAFEQLRKRLEAEGLFDPARKRPLPAFPRRVALVTSPSGAAVKDLIHVASRRWPPLELVVVPVRVQGAGAAEEIAAGIRLADARGFDVLVVGRGGGSLEDLWAFNEEPVARAIFLAKTPVVSAVGHEVDVTISDLVADVRAATPSAAAELVTPDRAEVMGGLRGTGQRLTRAVRRLLDDGRRRVDAAASARPFRRPLERVHEAGIL
ncbi:MAG: exodeoxyribonuclease VII large subunit, partial [Planctomycetes bacterium]|nr:exodeoxyribonuclease VII large subunit [Planctomycetota bacterium]